MAYAVPFNVSALPSAPGEEPNLRFQKPSLIQHRGRRAHLVLIGKERPARVGCTPSNRKKLAETISTGTRSGSPTPTRLKLSGR